jgi:hypothetical protein
MAAEIWKIPKSLNGKYEVSNLGRARFFTNGRVRKLKRCKRGYLHLGVSNGKGGCTNLSISRLICEAFNGTPFANADVDHINRIRDDNRSENLRWVTRKDNLHNRIVASGVSHFNAKLTPEMVNLIRDETNFRGRDGALAKVLGVARKTVSDARLGKQWRNI